MQHGKELSVRWHIRLLCIFIFVLTKFIWPLVFTYLPNRNVSYVYRKENSFLRKIIGSFLAQFQHRKRHVLKIQQRFFLIDNFLWFSTRQTKLITFTSNYVIFSINLQFFIFQQSFCPKHGFDFIITTFFPFYSVRAHFSS